MRVRLLKVFLHLWAWSAALALALWITGSRPAPGAAVAAVVLFLASKTVAGVLSGSFRELWRHTSLEDLVALVEAAVATTALLALVLALVPPLGLSPGVALVDGGLSLALMGPMRVLPRIYVELVRPALKRGGRSIVLAGRAELVDLELRRLQRQAANGDQVVGLVLDGPPLDGSRLRRVRVLGRMELKRLLRLRRIADVILVPPASAAFTAELEQLCRHLNVPCRSAASLLSLGELVKGADQLLDRLPRTLEAPAVRRAIKGRHVLITGAGGSIGSELARQLLSLGPSSLTLVDRAENALFQVERDLLQRDPTFLVESRIVDVRDAAAVERLFAAHRPNVVFHAAAHKHVPLMERHPAEAVLNNVVGTRVMADAAHGFGVESFVFISTDKAVHPSSVMGATKRLGEYYVRGMAARSRTRFVAVRFGNVLGSNGSVLPIFIEQIQRGGPVTVTHAEMSRYFMSIPEACKLVFDAAALEEAGGLFVLDMGQPVKILDLARRLIERAGLRPGEDIDIVMSGPRPGEKLAEQLTFDDERTAGTACPGVRQVAIDVPAWEPFLAQLEQLEDKAHCGDSHAVLALLSMLIPGYLPSAFHQFAGEPALPAVLDVNAEVSS